MHNPLEQSNNRTPACGDRLRSLPTEMLPPYNWQEFQRRSQERSFAAKDALGWRHVAAAAALLLLVCGIAVWGRLGSSGRRSVVAEGVSAAGMADRKSNGQVPAGDVDALRGLHLSGGDARPSRAGDDAQTGDAAPRSRAIESWLATLPREPVVVHVGTRAAVTRLEDRIAQVDDLLTSVRLDGMGPDRLAALQQERVRLVGSLAQVRYAEVVASESP
jgi:hypothetical protein